MNTDTHEATPGSRLESTLLYLSHMHVEDDELLHADDEAPFFLGQITAKAGRIYEKIRASVDNKEEYVLRRYAIRRIAKRIMWFSRDPQIVTSRLLRDLYKGGYLPEDRVSRHVEQDVIHTVSTFLALSGEATRDTHTQRVFTLRKHLLDICAGALEDHLYPTHIDEASVRLLARIGDETLVIGGVVVSEEDRIKLIYLAAWKALFGADHALLLYKLWQYEHPSWSHTGDEELLRLARELPTFIADCDRLFAHPLLPRLILRMRNYAVAVSVIHELLLEYGDGIRDVANDPAGFEVRIREHIAKMYRRDVLHAGKKAVGAVVYILATKAVLALTMEFVYVSVLKQPLNYLALGINVLFHPALLFATTSGLFVPPEQNTKRIVTLIFDIISPKQLPEVEVIPVKKGIFSDISLGLYFGFLTCLLVTITWLLDHLGFHVVDIFLFIIFLALVLYFSFRVRYGARRMQLSGAKEGFLRSTLELIALPIVSVGRYLVTKFESLNVLAVFLDVVVETPLRLLFEFIDTFSSVLKEKKDEMYS